MKNITKYLAFATFAILASACMDGGYGDMDDVTASTAFGNDTITEHNVLTLKQIRERIVKHTTERWVFDENELTWSKKETTKDEPIYGNALKEYREYVLVDEDIQMKVRVTGNDLGGNIYNKVAVQDANGDALFICVYSGGMFSYLPVGQELLVNLKGLYIGTYGYQRQIGTPYTTSNGNTYPGRMANELWQKHFKLIPDTDIDITPIEFTSTIQNNIDEYAGRLMYIDNATITGADSGKLVWAPEKEAKETNEFSISRGVVGFPASVVVYTSTSAKFAGDVVPQGKVRLTGIFSRYNTTWQIQLRTADDCTPYKPIITQ